MQPTLRLDPVEYESSPTASFFITTLPPRSALGESNMLQFKIEGPDSTRNAQGHNPTLKYPSKHQEAAWFTVLSIPHRCFVINIILHI
jgi:hypothetical protein